MPTLSRPVDYIFFDSATYRGQVNDLKVQRIAVSWLIQEIGLFYNGPLETVLMRCAKYLGPVGPGTRTLRRCWTYYLMYGELPGQGWRRELYRSRGKRKRRGRSGWTKTRERILHKIVHRHPTYFIDELHKVYIESSGDETKSDKQIWNKLVDMGLTLQVITYVAAERDQEERARYQQALNYDCQGRPEMLIFIDETAKGRNESRRKRMWARRGSKAELINLLHQTKERYTMLGACNINGFIPEACEPVLRERGPNDPDRSRGTIDRKRFLDWARERLVPQLGNYALGEPNSIVILDNAIIHHDDEFRDMIREAGAKELYLSRYSPDFNPIEYFFIYYITPHAINTAYIAMGGSKCLSWWYGLVGGCIGSARFCLVC